MHTNNNNTELRMDLLYARKSSWRDPISVHTFDRQEQHASSPTSSLHIAGTDESRQTGDDGVDHDDVSILHSFISQLMKQLHRPSFISLSSLLLFGETSIHQSLLLPLATETARLLYSLFMQHYYCYYSLDIRGFV